MLFRAPLFVIIALGGKVLPESARPYPNATSSTIITRKPAAKAATPRALLRPPISGSSWSATTKSIAPAAKARHQGSSGCSSPVRASAGANAHGKGPALFHPAARQGQGNDGALRNILNGDARRQRRGRRAAHVP